MKIEHKATLLCVLEEVREGPTLSKKTIESPSDLIVYGASKKEMCLNFYLHHGTKSIDSILFIDMVINLNLESVRAHPQGAKRDMYVGLTASLPL